MNIALPNEKSFQALLRRNLVLPLVLAVLISAAFVGLLLYALNLHWWTQHSDHVLTEANEMLKLTVDAETGVRGYMLTKKTEFLEPFRNSSPKIVPKLDNLQKLVSDNSEQSARVTNLRAAYDAWARDASDLSSALRPHDTVEGVDEMRDRKHLMDNIRKAFDEFTGEEKVLLQQRAEAGERFVRFALIAIVAGGFLLGGLLAWSARNTLITLSGEYRTLLHSERERAEHLERENWIRTGVGKLNQMIGGSQSLEAVADHALAFFAEYIGARVGVCYVREGEGPRLYRHGLLATNKATMPESLLLGDGMVGRVAQQGELEIVSGVADDYFKLTSALGSMMPRHVVLMPAKNDGMLRAVVEMGFLEKPEEKAAELLRRASEPLGLAIESAINRKRILDLLEETQKQAEELQAQQEELRVSNEELESQASALRETQRKMEGQQVSLEEMNQQLEEQSSTVSRRNVELTSAQEQLNDKARELESANRYKSEFLANMSHELRTPLNSSLILAKLLMDNPKGNLSGEQVDFARTIYSAGNDLLNIINDILDLSKVEAGKLEIKPEELAIKKITTTLDEQFRVLARERGLEFKIDVTPNTDERMFIDRLRLEQVLKNLLSNAFKFTEKGGVTLRVSTVGETMHFSVVDSGIGIPLSAQAVIFEAFRQANGTINRKYGGTGLGLSISRDLSRLLGGHIVVKSQEGKGSTFTLVVPRRYDPTQVQEAPPHAAPAPVAPPVMAAPVAKERPTEATTFVADDREALKADVRTVLIVEDEAPFAKILSDLAHEMFFQTLITDKTSVATSLLDRYRVDAIVLDVQLPDGSGLVLLDRVKLDPKTRHIPVHIVSGTDYSEMALQMGAIGYAMKPVGRDELKNSMLKLQAKIEQVFKRVLVVEDDPTQREAILKLLGDDRVKVEGAETGAEALEKLRGGTFDCMVMDLKLPDMSGSELLAKMSEADGPFPPVIVYTGRELTRDEEMQLLRHSRSVIIKGARSPERLLDEVSLFLHRVESNMTSERQAMLKDLRNREKILEGRSILVVDDDVRNVFALSSVFEPRGARVEIARNGREALEKLDAIGTVDLVLMDIMMPEMDGYEAIRRIRGNPDRARLPIIAVTAKARKEDQDLALAAGANDYLAKPIDVDRLLSLVRVWMPKNGRGA